MLKRKHFLGGYVDDTTYNQVYDSYHEQFEETVKIKNVFNIEISSKKIFDVYMNTRR